MKIKLLISIIGLLFTFTAAATEAEKGEPTPEQTAEDAYIFQCATIEKVVRHIGQDMKDLTAEDVAKLKEMRKTTFDVIKRGRPAIKELLERGDKADIGGFGVLLACGVVEQIAPKVKSRGCLNLETNEKIKGGPGIKACKEILAKYK